MGKSVVAEVILRDNSGESALAAREPLGRDGLRRLRMDDDIATEVTSKLREQGIEVLQRGRVSLSIRAEVPVFERVFRTHLRERRERPDAAIGSSYVAADPVRVPADLDDKVDRVVLPTPAIYCA
jgi:hypothetical protein